MKINEEELKKKLTPEQYSVLREGKTEHPFTDQLLANNEKGVYKCGACGHELFSSDAKYDSGSGWPSFSDVADKESVKFVDDYSFGMYRIEVRCGNCDSHLGHMFRHGENSDGQTYCINSAALDFDKKSE